MIIRHFHLFNYKTLKDSGPICFGPGINVIIGRNNSGKSSLIEAVENAFAWRGPGAPKVIITLEIKGEDISHEIQNALNQQKTSSLGQNLLENSFSAPNFPADIIRSAVDEIENTPCFYLHFDNTKGNWIYTTENISITTDQFDKRTVEFNEKTEITEGGNPFNLGDLTLDLPQTPTERSICNSHVDECFPRHESPVMRRKETHSAHEALAEDIFSVEDINKESQEDDSRSATSDMKLTSNLDLSNLSPPDINSLNCESKTTEVADQLIKSCLERIALSHISTYTSKKYRFQAMRLIEDRSKIGIGSETQLNQDMSNLAGFLQHLQGKKPILFEEINECLRRIFPEIARVTIYGGQGNFEIAIWFHSVEPEPSHFMLSQCGSGVGQVLSILSVVIVMQEPSFIFIDEPQAFLHPGAARALIEILQSHPQHQYFITTHSPDIIKASDPASITLLKCKNLSTTAQSVDRNCLTGMRSILSEVGLKFSDFFGADQILWVEGPTEEKCFPIIIRKIGKKDKSIGKPVGLEILSVVSVGDFEKKRSELIFGVYNRLGTASSLFPPAAGFIFDREDRSESQRKELEKRMPNRVKFLPRRMYENYLLYPQAIAHVLNTEDTHENKSYDVDTIENWISQNRHKYLNANSNNEQEWRREVDAAKLLKNCFNELSESRVEFRKTRHSVQLTEWILDNSPGQLQELADFLSKTMQELDILQ